MAAIVREINSVTRFVRGRQAQTGTCDISLLTKFADTLIKMIDTLPALNASDAGLLAESLHDSPYGDEGTARINASIDAKLTASHDSPGGTTGRDKTRPHKADGPPPQFLKCWWNYNTRDDWTVFKDPKRAFSAKMTWLVERANSIGMANPDEQTLKWMLAMLLLLHYDELPTYKEIYNKLQELKRCCESERKHFEIQHLLKFPDNPNQLPTPVFAHAFPDHENPPLQGELSGVSTVASCIPLRANSRLLKGKKQQPPEIHNTTTVPELLPAKSSAASSAGRMPSNRAPIDLSTDADEELLWLEYQDKVNKLKMEKLKHVKTEVVEPAEPPAPPSTINIRRHQDGTLKLMPRSHESHVGNHRLLAKQPCRTESSAKPPDESDLDPWTRQAMSALKSRNGKDKETKAADKAAKKKAEEAAATVATKACTKESKKAAASVAKKDCKKEAMKVAKKEAVGSSDAVARPKPPSKHHGAGKPTALPKKRSRRGDVEDVPKSKIMSAMPRQTADGSNPDPVSYNGGVIYTSQNIKKFRALRLRGDRYTEKAHGWTPKTHGTMKKAWASAVQCIDEYKKKKK